MNYFVVLFLIGGLIFIHELGHFIAARLMGIPVACFSLGFGPRLWSWKKGETDYRLSWIPLGGYVLPQVEDENAFFQIPRFKRIWFSLAGPLANFLLALALMTWMNGMKTGWQGYNVLLTPWLETFKTGLQVVFFLPRIFSHPQQFSGVLGIVFQGAQLIDGQFIKMLWLGYSLSIQLAIFNLLPIPGLDGGKLLLYLLEKIHPRMLELHLPLTLGGLAILVALMLYATVQDVVKIFT